MDKILSPSVILTLERSVYSNSLITLSKLILEICKADVIQSINFYATLMPEHLYIRPANTNTANPVGVLFIYLFVFLQLSVHTSTFSILRPQVFLALLSACKQNVDIDWLWLPVIHNVMRSG